MADVTLNFAGGNNDELSTWTEGGITWVKRNPDNAYVTPDGRVKSASGGAASYYPDVSLVAPYTVRMFGYVYDAANWDFSIRNRYASGAWTYYEAGYNHTTGVTTFRRKIAGESTDLDTYDDPDTEPGVGDTFGWALRVEDSGDNCVLKLYKWVTDTWELRDTVIDTTPGVLHDATNYPGFEIYTGSGTVDVHIESFGWVDSASGVSIPVLMHHYMQQ